MILLLLAAAAVSGLVGDPLDTIAILVIVVLNATIGVVQGYRAERALQALRAMAAPHARVVRSAVPTTVRAADLVPGDLVLLEAGGIVPADLRLTEVVRLEIGEAALTGESVPVTKSVAPVLDPLAPLGDRSSMAFRGTEVTTGRGAGLVVATGADTEVGRVAGLLVGVEDVRTPLQRRLDHLSRRLAAAVLAICAVVLLAGLLRGEDPLEMLLTSVSLAVAAVPEALPAVVTISLALGASAMVRTNALVRRLPAVETLGSVTYICTDKTGTLTANRMTVDATWTPDGDERALARAVAACNDAQVALDAGYGDPTEVALVVYARDVDGDHRVPVRVAEIPFDPQRRRMTTVHRRESAATAPRTEPGGAGPRRAAPGDADLPRFVVYAKGAPEAVLACCDLDPANRQVAEAHAHALAAGGLRLLGVATRDLDAVPDDLVQAEQHLRLLGLVGLLDPPRPEAATAVAECRSAGIVPVMITGDHPDTATAVATRVGILGSPSESPPAGDLVLTGRDLAHLDDADLARTVTATRVYARVDPAQKIQIVTALQSGGQVVAMTGDGVNDAPALRRAEIGVAMGRSGTEVARGAASLVLLDDNFATIVGAVREGRRIYDNIRRFVRYALSGNAGEIWVMFAAPFLGLPVPLLPLQILWVNLVTDGLPGLALAREPAEPDVMRRPPRPPGESVFAHGLGWHVGWVGLLIGGLCLGAMAWAYRAGDPAWRTVVFTAVVFCQLAHALAIRSERQSLVNRRFLANPALLAAVALTVGLQATVVYLPALQDVFRTSALGAAQVAVCAGCAVVVLLAVEAEKALVRRGLLYRRH
jgi:Ca2+-transporting ATPase